MEKKLGCVLLVDDDEATNFFNEMIVGHLDCTEKVVSLDNGAQALSYLKEAKPTSQPDLIFLDINMPAMNGWEFLEQYRALNNINPKTRIVMLTTSLYPADEEKAIGSSDITQFLSKPLTENMLENVIQTHFSDTVSW